MQCCHFCIYIWYKCVVRHFSIFIIISPTFFNWWWYVFSTTTWLSSALFSFFLCMCVCGYHHRRCCWLLNINLCPQLETKHVFVPMSMMTKNSMNIIIVARSCMPSFFRFFFCQLFLRNSNLFVCWKHLNNLVFF